MDINLPRRELKTPLQDTRNITERRDGYDFSWNVEQLYDNGVLLHASRR
jgi:hypothetical protein